jgi:hypothetical protein
MITGKACLDQPLHQSVRTPAHEHGIRFGQGLQTRGEIHCIAENGDRRVATPLDPPNHSESGVEAYAQLRPHTVLCLETGPSHAQSLADSESCSTRAQGRIFESGWRTENRHYAIARKALNDATLLAHGFFHELRETSHQRKGRLLPRPFREGCEANHVGEQDCDLPAFCFHAGLRTISQWEK